MNTNEFEGVIKRTKRKVNKNIFRKKKSQSGV